MQKILIKILATIVLLLTINVQAQEQTRLPPLDTPPLDSIPTTITLLNIDTTSVEDFTIEGVKSLETDSAKIKKKEKLIKNSGLNIVQR